MLNQLNVMTMPNWATLSYACITNDEKEAKKLYNAIHDIDKRRNPLAKSDFGRLWLGCFVRQLGGDEKKIHCRGEITDYDIETDNDQYVVKIHQETAWCEMEEVRFLIEKTFPTIKVLYIVEEPGCEIFCTNDAEGRFFPERYLLDGNEVYEYFETIEQVISYLKKNKGIDITDSDKIDEILDEYNELHEDDDEYLYFHEFTVE